jgi:phosphatidylserine synthase 2
MVRVVTQFSPYSWIEYDWRPTASLKRWFAMIIISVLFFLAELGNFYLKFILWVPASHNICLARVLFILLGGGVAMREAFEYLDNP